MPSKPRKTANSNKRSRKSPGVGNKNRSAKQRTQATAPAGQLKEPKSPMPAQHQRKPGLESKLRPRPKYEAPFYKGSGKLAGKVALITGGDSGIGRAVAVLFAREGADVAITHLPQEVRDADETLQAIEAAGRRCLLLEGDLTDASFCPVIVERTVAEFGTLDILVN